MSECVVRMELPKKCQGCPVEICGCCGITNKNIMLWNGGFPDERPSDCPILAVLPEKHGRLVDADAFEEEIKAGLKRMDPCEMKSGFSIALPMISVAPTIVQATEGGKE